MTKIISKTPLRISFVGGGTDISDFYRKYGGAVISTAIDKYITVEVSRRDDNQIIVKTPDNWQEVNWIDEIRHPLIRESMRKTGVQLGVSIKVKSDIPARGTGLGSSSALTVGLLNALYTYQRKRYDLAVYYEKYGKFPLTERLAYWACEIEIDRLGNPIGKQDQYIAAYGGFRQFTFEPNDDVSVEAIEPPSDLEKHLMLFYTGIQRQAGAILNEQKQTANPETLLKMKAQVQELSEIFMKGGHTAKIGAILHEAWKLKRSLTDCISTDQLDATYRLALDAGALGGKLLGAGGGGYFLFYVPVEKQAAVIAALDGLCSHTPFRFEPRGSRLRFFKHN